ncbi:MAG: hypothetical protein ACRENL_03170 [Candidatus Dormibacteria bacterium]
MSDSLPPREDLDAVAASLQADARDAGVFFQVLCEKLLSALPENTEVERDRSVFKKRRRARRINVRLGDETFEAELERGKVTCRHIHSVHGVGGGLPWSKPASVDEWVRALVEMVSREARTEGSAAAALRSLVT